MLRRALSVSILVLILLLPTLPVRGQPTDTFDAIQMESDLKAVMREEGIKGVLLMLVDGDEIVYLQSIGENADGDPFDTSQPFVMGRLAESVLTTLTMAQIENGLFDPKARIVNLRSGFSLSRADATPVVTPSRLMTHSAGLGSAELHPLQALSFEELSQVPVEFYPGARFSYCTRCTATLVELLQGLSGQSVESLLQQNIFYPLQMDETSLQDGEILTTASDLAKFMSVHLQAGRWRTVQLITPESIKTLHSGIVATGRNDSEFYGYGWFVTPDAGLVVVDKEDDRLVTARDMGDYTAQISLAPIYHRGIFLLTDQPTHGLDDLMAVVVNAYFDWSPPEFEPFRLPYYEGHFVSDDVGLGGDVFVEEADGEMQITYNEQTAPATFVDQRTLVFALDGQQITFYYDKNSQASLAILSKDGVTAPFYRKG